MTATSDELAVEMDGTTLHLTLSRRTRSNALSPTLVETLIDVLNEAPTKGVELAVFRGEGGNFCSGFDLADLESLSDGDLLLRLVRIEHFLQCVAHAPFMTLALAHGSVIGAGCDLFCACSERVAAPDAVFRMPGWRFGIALGTRRLVRTIGAAAARSILASSRMFNADEAQKIGLSTSTVGREDWPQTIGRSREVAASLEPISRSMLLALTATDTRAADMASLVESASRPGLKARIQRYRSAERSLRR
ncbi:enoyl-CoA hydratase/isomerase family protein [Bradyrhizobium sp. NP1]|uniref:enoyl-CoA hydratase/isomerase family protein n=1 Tax=Bradyrhizobium sp. NP1 TaxID=3049772 RepID=UPI0025A6734F|nr:enoyl-CoA hydratase/isomerase family protein [Bradyrhizobium sp. NP1]WJR79024.1 enoyl-CoA hydratase/isomerase family protein [Bradyrhizobium sp. NP1]